MNTAKKQSGWLASILLALLSVLFLTPIFVVLINSVKGKFFISDSPFSLPTAETFVALENYVTGIVKSGFLKAFGYSAFITVGSVAAIILFTSMASWYIVRVKSGVTNTLYYIFVFSMIVPFQMVMFTMSKVANMLGLDNPVGIIFIYLGFGAGLSVFIFAGFIRSVPLDIEEAAEIDGCTPVQTFFLVVFPILRSTAITLAILQAMWVWNDYLLPLLVIGSNYKTIPLAVQGVLTGSYGARDMGALMAMLVVAIIPIIIFYLSSQKHIIKGVVAGAVKG